MAETRCSWPRKGKFPKSQKNILHGVLAFISNGLKARNKEFQDFCLEKKEFKSYGVAWSWAYFLILKRIRTCRVALPLLCPRFRLLLYEVSNNKINFYTSSYTSVRALFTSSHLGNPLEMYISKVLDIFPKNFGEFVGNQRHWISTLFAEIQHIQYILSKVWRACWFSPVCFLGNNVPFTIKRHWAHGNGAIYMCIIYILLLQASSK